jgi:PKD repeat protein
MGLKNLNYIFVLAVVIALCAVQAFALPDNPPTCSLSSNTADTATTAVLTAVSVDTLSNPGVDTITIYENGAVISTKNCAFATSCVSVKTVLKTSGGDFSYYAVCRDRAGQQTTSSTIGVHFDGMNRPPVIDTYTPSGPTTITEDRFVDFRITAHDPDGDALTYEWRIDGAVVAGATGTSYRFSRSLAVDTTYIIAVYVYDGRGGVDVQTWTVTIRDSVPTVDLTGIATGTECTNFTFNANVVSYDSVASVAWDFGDGTVATGTSRSASHVYAESGTYTVRVTVTDSDGDAVTDTLTVIVSDISPDVDAGDDQTTEAGVPVNFSGTATMPCAADTIQNYTWDFGDGETASGQNATHTYDEPGEYEVTLTVCDEDSCSTDTLTVTVTSAGPDADFYYVPEDPVEGDVVNFYDNSTSLDPIVSWAWDLDGDGDIDSTEQNPNWTYAEEGDYTVCLTVTDEDGDSDTQCYTITIGNNPIAGVDLVLNTTSGVEPLDVEANCTAVGGNTPYDFMIDFGDGSVPVLSDSATHTYVQNGTYVVNCTVTDADGDEMSDTEVVVVDDTIPSGDFTWDPADPSVFENVTFNATVDAYDGVASYDWDFGDSSSGSTEEDPVHVYTDGGDYNVTLTVTDGDGSVIVIDHVVHVADNPPGVDLVVDPLNGTEPLIVDIDCTGIGGDGVLSYEIDLGDGSAPVSTDHITYTYVQNGTYTVNCTITDIDGDAAINSTIVDVYDTVPTVNFTYTPTDPVEGDSVDFDATATAYDGIVSYAWDFGDVTFNDTEDPTHVYTVEGTYVVVLTVTDGDGSIAIATDTVIVGPNDADVTLMANVTSGYEPLTVSFGCIALAGNPPYGYSLDFGDGSAPVTTPIVDYTYVQNGTYVANCTVTDADGDVSSDIIIINVLDTEPDVYFDYHPTSPIEGDEVHFNGTVTAYDTPVTWVWDFGDGSSSTEEDPIHSYASERDYNVTLTATDADGSVVVYGVTLHVGNNAPFVNLLADPTSGPEGLNVSFNCTVTDGNAPLTFLMDYGDSTSSTDQNSSHVYSVPGTYTATCTVADVDGDVDSDFVLINVADNPPVVNLTAVPTTAPEGMTIDFNCSITGGDAPFGVLLDFGDGSSTASPVASHNYTLEGIYTATCNVSDVDGDVGSDSELINITNNVPVVNLIVNATSGFEPMSVAYNCTVGAGNAPFTYAIDFGDSTTSTSATGTHDYPTPGVYPMVCTVTDVDGDWDDDTVGIHVIDNPPIVNLTAIPTAGLEGIDVDFVCTVTGGNAPMSYVLDFGDGSSTTSLTATHNYPLEGVYNATCTVTDADADVGVDSEIINISNNAPVVNLVTNVTAGLEPLTVLFNCTVGGGNAPFMYMIDFGDGSSSASSTAVHTYATEGEFNTTCTVTDVDGDVGSDLQLIQVINNPPVVDLVAFPTGGLEGVDILFTCNVLGGNAPFAYVLDFGDGSSTTVSSATHNYPLEGVYNATCTVMDFDGDVDSDSELITITNNAPVVNLLVNTTSGFEPLSVAYNCTVGGGNPPLGYLINFGDGATSASATGTHIYPLPGTYDMSCTVTDTDGDSDMDDVLITVINNAPVVDLIASPTVGLEGVNVSFNCSVTGGNAPISILLDFGDGTTTTSSMASHVYPLEGLYNANCTATDADGDVGSDAELINITNNVPVVNLVTNVTAGTEPLSVFFNCTLVGGGNPPFTYRIDFGDGSATVASSTATHTYLQNSTYDASCIITDTDGDVSVPDIASIDVYDSEPDANFTYAPSSPLEGDMISFTDTSTAYDGIVSWSWNLGDGNTSSVANPTHTYFTNGSYIVTLTVTDGDGSATSHVEVIVVGNNAPVVDVTATPSSGTEPRDTTIACSVVSGGNAPFTYSILYGDGTSTTSPTSIKMYLQNGVFPVVCQVTDVDGDVGTDVVTVTVADTVPTVNFNWTPVNPTAGDNVSFTDLSTAYDGIASWRWDFENDGIADSVLQNPSHVFTSPGLYIVNLSVTDNDGSVASTIRTVAVNISIGAPIIFGVNAVDLTNVSANITWGTDQSADSRVDYGLTPALGSVATDASYLFNHAVLLSGLTPNTTYYYTVTSCSMFAMCTTSSTYNFTTLVTVIPDTTAPGPVTGLGETAVGSDWINWAWTNPADLDFNHVELWLNGSFVANTSASSYNVTGLAASTTYQIEVVTVDAVGNRNAPGATDLATTVAGADLTPPAPVTGLGETAVGSDWINWAWTNPADLDFNHVELWLNGTNVANTSASSYNVTGLAASTTYQLTVITVDNVGNRNTPGVSDLAATTSGADLTPPAPVTGVNESGVGTDWIMWAWTNPSDLDFNHVELWLNGTNVANTSGTSYNFTGLLPGTTYQLTIITVDNSGNRNTPGVSDTATTDVIDTVPVVTASATPTSGLIPLAVQFNATVVGGESPLSFAWDFDGDGIVDSTLQNPLYIYNVVGAYTATVNVTDVDGDWDNDSVTINANPVTHDIAVNSINYTKEGRTVYLYDALQINASVTNEGTVSETFTLQFEIDGVVVGSQALTLGAGASTVASFNWGSSSPEGFHTLLVRAVPVAGETDLSDQSSSKVMRTWSVDDLVQSGTRYIVYWAGVAYVPVGNAYVTESFYDLRVELSSATALITPPAVQYTNLAPSETKILMWSVAAVPGDVLTVWEGNSEVTFSATV